MPSVPGHTQFLDQIRVKTYVGTPSFYCEMYPRTLGHTHFQKRAYIPESNCITGHIFVLISTYQVSSAWLECRALKGRKKRFVPRPGIEPGTFHLPGGCSTTKLPRPCTFCAVLSILYYFYNHPWMRRLHCRNARVLNYC